MAASSVEPERGRPEMKWMPFCMIFSALYMEMTKVKAPIIPYRSDNNILFGKNNTNG
jgi:hypothetical protein